MKKTISDTELRRLVAHLSKEYFKTMGELGCEPLVCVSHPVFGEDLFMALFASKITALKMLEAVKDKVGQAIVGEKMDVPDGKSFSEIIDKVAGRKKNDIQ